MSQTCPSMFPSCPQHGDISNTCLSFCPSFMFPWPLGHCLSPLSIAKDRGTWTTHGSLPIICQKLGFPEGGLSSCQLHLSMPNEGVGESQSVVQMLAIRTEMWLRRWSWEACFAPAGSLLVNCAAMFLHLRKGAAELTWNSQPGLCRHGQGTAETQGCHHLQGTSSL